jgi:hypothetical protein
MLGCCVNFVRQYVGYSRLFGFVSGTDAAAQRLASIFQLGYLDRQSGHAGSRKFASLGRQVSRGM